MFSELSSRAVSVTQTLSLSIDLYDLAMEQSSFPTFGIYTTGEAFHFVGVKCSAMAAAL